MHADYHLNMLGTTWRAESYCFAPDCLLEEKKGKKGKKEKEKKNVLIRNLSNSRSKLFDPILGIIVLQTIIFL